MTSALLIGFTLPADRAEELYKIDSLPAVQTTKFAWSFVNALTSKIARVRLLSFSPVQSFPRGRKLLFRSYVFTQGEIKGEHLGFVNFVVLKHLSRLFQLFMYARPRVLAQKPDVVFLHGVHSPLLIFGVYLARKGHTVIPILTDPPGVVLPTDSGAVRFLKQLDRVIVRRLLSKFAGVIALADGIPEQLGIDLPRLVFPGIVDNNVIQALSVPVAPWATPAAPELIYAGTISEGYGLRRLVGAARLLPEVHFSLFGTGDLIEEIAAMRLPNVALHGFASPSDLPARLKAASLLVNCRPSDDEVAVMSFPSKLIEYALTEVPVLTTRLPSIPEQLRDAFLYIDEETDEGFAAAIERALSASQAERQALGSNARSKVLEAYSSQAVGAAVAGFVGRVLRT